MLGEAWRRRSRVRWRAVVFSAVFSVRWRAVFSVVESIGRARVARSRNLPTFVPSLPLLCVDFSILV